MRRNVEDIRGIEKTKRLSKWKGYLLFCVTAFFCAFLWMAEHDLAKEGNILWTGRYLLKILSFSLAAGSAAGSLLAFLVYGVAEGRWKKGCMLKRGRLLNRIPCPKAGKGFEVFKRKVTGKYLWLGVLLLIMLSWLPCYLAYYPAICSYDATIQTGQIADGSYNDHHPIAHTLLIQGSMELGEKLFNSVNAGVGIYGALQQLFLAGVFTYGITALHRHRVRWGWIWAVLLFAMFYPFHWYMSVSLIKDTVFAGFFLLQMVAFCELLAGENCPEKKGPGRKRPAVLFLTGTVGMILFRNNGKYAMLVLLFFLLLCICFGKKARKFWGRLFACAAAGFLAGNILLSALFSLTGAQQGDKREMLSLPIQQLARCMIYHGGVGVLPEDDGTMGEQDKALIRDFLLNEGYREYRPDISDPVKRHTNTYVARYRAKDFITTYLRLFANYPGDYLNAALAVNAGYLSPADVTHAYINVREGESGLGYVQTKWGEEELNARGIYKASLWEGLHECLEKWADENAYLKLPVIKYLFVPGTFLWLYLLLVCCVTVYGNYSRLLPLSLAAGYYVTLFLGPTVQLRYLYPLMIALPFLALLLLSGGNSKLPSEDAEQKELERE